MRKFVFLFICVAILGIASALLNCYNCKGASCETEMKTWGTRMCGDSNTIGKDHVPVCVKINYKDKATSKTMVERKCAISEVRNGKPDFHCTAPDNNELIDCPICQTDLCNSAPSIRFSLFTFSSVIVAYLGSKIF